MSDNPISTDEVKDTPNDTPEEEVVVKSEVGDADSSQDAEETPAEDMKPRLERLGGEPAPDITPDEFARLQQSGQIHIDPRGRVRSTRSEDADAGVSLRKRRAWYV